MTHSIPTVARGALGGSVSNILYAVAACPTISLAGLPAVLLLSPALREWVPIKWEHIERLFLLFLFNLYIFWP